MKLEEYKALMKEKALISVVFSAARNQEEVFYSYDEEDDIHIKMHYRDFFYGRNKADNYGKAIGAIRSPKTVVITKVDESKREVEVSYFGALSLEREKAKAAIDAKLEKGEEVRVRGVVVDVRGSGKQSFAVVRFLDSNLKGLLWCNRWSPTYIANLRDAVAVGTEVEVDVIGLNNSNVEPRCRYLCARDVVIGNVWKDIEKRYQKGDCVNVRCDNPWGEFYSGSIAGEKELPVRMLVPPKKPGVAPLLLVPGLTYQCYVVSVAEENHTFRVMPMRVCNATPGVKKVVRIIT